MSDIDEYEQKLKRKLEYSECQQNRSRKMISNVSKDCIDDDYESYQQYILGSSKIDKSGSIYEQDKEYNQYIDAIIQKNYNPDKAIIKDPDLIDINKIGSQSQSDIEDENIMFEQNYQKFQQSQILKTGSNKNNSKVTSGEQNVDGNIKKVLSKSKGKGIDVQYSSHQQINKVSSSSLSFNNDNFNKAILEQCQIGQDQQQNESSQFDFQLQSQIQNTQSDHQLVQVDSNLRLIKELDQKLDEQIEQQVQNIRSEYVQKRSSGSQYFTFNDQAKSVRQKMEKESEKKSIQHSQQLGQKESDFMDIKNCDRTNDENRFYIQKKGSSKDMIFHKLNFGANESNQMRSYTNKSDRSISRLNYDLNMEFSKVGQMIRSGQLQEAIDFLVGMQQNQSLNIELNFQNKIYLYYLMSETYYRLNRFQQAVNQSLNALDIYNQQKTDLINIDKHYIKFYIFQLNGIIARILDQNKQYSRAVKYYQQMVQIHEETEQLFGSQLNSSEIENVYYCYGKALFHDDQVETALKMFQLSEQHICCRNIINYQKLYFLYQSILQTVKGGQQQIYYEYAKKVVDIYEQQKVKISEEYAVYLYKFMSDYQFEKEQYADYSMYYQKYLWLQQNKEQKIPYKELLKMSEILYKNNEIQLAQQSFLKLLDLKYNDKACQIKHMNKVIVYLAEIEYILGNYKESLMLYKKALLIFQYCKYKQKQKQPQVEINMIINIICLNLELGIKNEHFYLKYRQLIQQLDQQQMLIYANEIGNTFRKYKQFNRAIEQYLFVISKYEEQQVFENENHHYLGVICINLAQTHKLNDNIAQAIIYYQKAIVYLEQSNNKQSLLLIKQTASELAHIFRNQNKMKQSAYYFYRAQ